LRRRATPEVGELRDELFGAGAWVHSVDDAGRSTAISTRRTAKRCQKRRGLARILTVTLN
jgi:hypothetical protein